MLFGISKIIGSAFKTVGLGRFTPYVERGFNIISGNWFGVARDVEDLVGQFSGSGFLPRAARNAPLGNFGGNQRSAIPVGYLIRENRIINLIGGFKKLTGGYDTEKGNQVLDDFSKINAAFGAIKDFTDKQTALPNTRAAYYSQTKILFNAQI
jgi:hypothetical protein